MGTLIHRRWRAPQFGGWSPGGSSAFTTYARRASRTWPSAATRTRTFANAPDTPTSRRRCSTSVEGTWPFPRLRPAGLTRHYLPACSGNRPVGATNRPKNLPRDMRRDRAAIFGRCSKFRHLHEYLRERGRAMARRISANPLHPTRSRRYAVWRYRSVQKERRARDRRCRCGCHKR